MLPWLFWIPIVAALLAFAAFGVAAFGHRQWQARLQWLTAKIDARSLAARRRPGVPHRYESSELEGLPAPVQRYFRAVLKEGQAIVSAVAVAQAGTIDLSSHRPNWKRFTADQRVVTRRPGFLWNAKVSVWPGVRMYVQDGYVAGKGLLHAAVLGAWPVARVIEGDELARAQLMRFLAEAPWYPTALLPSQGVRWESVDDRSAQATLVDGSTAVTLLFAFDEAGLVESVRADSRAAMVGKKLVMLPWEGRWSAYRTNNGMTVPMAAEVAWIRPAGRRVCFRGTVTSLRYEYAPRHRPRPNVVVVPPRVDRPFAMIHSL